MWFCFRLLAAAALPGLATPPPHPATEGGESRPLFLSGASLRAADEGDQAPQITRSQASLAARAAVTMKDEVALLATVTLLGVLLQGGLAPAREVGGPRTLRSAFLPPGSAQGWGSAGKARPR